MMSLLCTAQTVWNKGLKKHWFPILINYGYGCILTRWTCLWLGTCNIIIRWQIIDFCRSGNNPRRVRLFVVNVYLRGRYLHVFEGVAYFIFKYFSLKIAFVFVSNRQKNYINIMKLQHIFQYIPKCVTVMFLPWNFPLNYP